jgi:hypothetical protein
MQRREIVERAITFNSPPRIPMKFDVVGINDCHDIWTPDPTGWTWDFDGSRADEWGCVWSRSAVDNTGQVTGHPLAEWSALDRFRWPDPDDPARYAGFEAQFEGADDRFVMFCFGHGLWERLYMLRGMANALSDFYVAPDQVREVIDRILEHHLRVLDNCRSIVGDRIDAAAMADDWGLQDRAFISTDLFREFFKPAYEKWFRAIKQGGCHTWMHSCGKINEVLEELIDAGLEVINNQQPNTVGLESFGRQFRGRVCFEAIVDTQTTLPRGSEEEIRAEARRLVESYGTPNGGFIASDYNDAEAIGVTFQRRLVMFEAFAEKGGLPGYREILERAARPRRGHSWGRHTGA